MKSNLQSFVILTIFLCSCNSIFSQKITVDSSLGLQELIENHLIDGCVEVSNITSSVNGSVDGLSSFAYFNRGTSNFPFETGIMLSTGNATSGGNIANSNELSEGSSNWGTDPDLNAVLGISNTLNATSIEFDFISISNQIQFNYILASEEYTGTNPCQYSDGFAFLIKEEASTGPYENIALIPGTNTPVNTQNIRNEIVAGTCPAVNEQYFDGYNIGDTNYNGRTTVLTATKTIVPYVRYHIKLIIADQSDETFDSAVFIQGNSFKILDLGEDIATCSNVVPLNADIQNSQASYAWFKDDVLINGETNATLNVTETGLYRVEVTVPLSSSTCTEIDEINIVLDTEETINPISPFLICDDVSGDEIEAFDLALKDQEIINNIPASFLNYTFSYHLSEALARSGTDPGVSGVINNTSNPQPIFVRIENTDTGCLGFTSFDLTVNPLPVITQPTTLEICDSDGNPNGQTNIDLTQKNVEITQSQSNLLVSYHYSALDAESGMNPITMPYQNTNPTETLYVRIWDSQTGCVSTTTLDINITNSPLVNFTTQYIDACDSDKNGEAFFDLTSVLSDIIGSTTNVTPTFHETRSDAENGSNPIVNTTNYQFTNGNPEPGSTTVYARIEDNSTGCASVVAVELHTNLLVTGTNNIEAAYCEEENNNGFMDIILSEVELFIANGIPDVVVTFYDSQNDLDNNNNPIDKSQPYQLDVTTPKTLYILIERNGCAEPFEYILRVNPIITFKPINPLPYCDTDQDGIVDVDLQSFDNEITNGNSSFNVTYYQTENDARTNGPMLPPLYSVNQNATVWALIANPANGCRSVNSFDIEIKTPPVATAPATIVACNNTGVLNIRLEDVIDEIVTNRTGLTIDFYSSFADADAAINPLNKNTFDAVTETLYVRVDDGECPNILPFDIIVNTIPVIPNISSFQLCENDNNQKEDFIFADKDADIINGQAGKTVYYFENEMDALNGNTTNAIDKNNPYTNISSPQTIYVRVENVTDANCFSTSSFTIQVASNPIYAPLTSYLVCDDASNDEKYVFDLNEKITQLKSGSPDPDNLNVSFHISDIDALSGNAPLSLNYTNATNPQTIYARMVNANSQCFVVESLDINIIEAPKVTQANIFRVCDVNNDGQVIFNLDDADYDILDRDKTNLVVHYFENLSDIDDANPLNNSAAIVNPNNYTNTSNPQTVYIKVTNTLSRCYSVVPLDLIVDLPPVLNNIGTLQICDNVTNTYDLSQIDNLIVNNPGDKIISYHNNQNDANNSISPVGPIFNYTSSYHIIFIRVENISNGCSQVGSFNLQINQNPVANTPPDLTYCDDNFDGFYEFNLDENKSAILGSQNATNLSVYYYNNDILNAEEDRNRLPVLHTATNGEIIYARVENTLTGCYDITQFTTYINPLPIVNINDIIPLCLDNLPLLVSADTGNPGDTYLWDTGATTPDVLFDIQDIGMHFVTVTTPNNCSVTKNFSLIESEEATINFTTKVDFADPNSITVDVSGIGNYVYILDNGEPQTSNVFNNVTLGRHLVTIRDLNGCQDVSKEVVVIDVPKFFTPNSDGYFDNWHIIGIEEIPGTLVYIFDRYGKLLKTLPDNSIGWNGTFNGQNMPADDYWFVAKVIQDGNAFEIKGHFALKR
ncbi:T9SS type B sorting domain-containing protein [Siansivirga zeaxanthinifaciens]|uniref:T9SS type B sorting domain-containing protein n=1 Tax=Siansivirga zeaxanthinifaciens CC-SAMT-1 TaxID=1454006 RepID=A0A0C5WC19_9FLAO|nr:choice-of-anchor L domain-containing protein [Siansivirga zeaxanthinifaciens]AJR04628.1 hypothetical protein AW14_14275 [Siansivirga zeaxanthinifaciens CC-SAMT-1]